MTSYNYSNSTLFEIKNDALRYTWAGWYMFVVLSSVIGDTTILYASIKYRAFNLNKVIVTFIQHVAVCDLVLSVIGVLPIGVSTVIGGDGWDMGRFCNYTRVYVSYYCYPAGTLLICGMTTTKLLMLTYPLRSSTWTSKLAHRVCLVIWLISFYSPITFLIVDKDDIYFDSRIFTHDYGFSSDTWNFLAPISSFIILLTPSVITIVATVMLIIKAVECSRKSNITLRWQGVTMVIVSASMYTVSVLPLSIYSIAEQYVEKNPDQPSPFYTHFYGVAFTVLTLNVIANFFTYVLTVSGFRAFVISRIKRWTPCLETLRQGIYNPYHRAMMITCFHFPFQNKCNGF